MTESFLIYQEANAACCPFAGILAMQPDILVLDEPTCLPRTHRDGRN